MDGADRPFRCRIDAAVEMVDGGHSMRCLLKARTNRVVTTGAVKPAALDHVTVATAVQVNRLVHSVYSRLLEIARHKVASSVTRSGIGLKQTFAKEGRSLRIKVSDYAKAKQFRRLKRP